MKNARKALVLGGGGVTGIAWELGLIAGLADLGVDLSTADLVIGTSAGSVVAAQVTSGVPVEELYARQMRDTSGEIAARVSRSVVLRWALASLLPGDDRHARVRLGRLALEAKTVPEADRLAVIEDRLPVHGWPERALMITAVETLTGELQVFDRNDGAGLVQAVAASCAIPMIWPPVTIDGHRYMDGGTRSPANVDLATNCGRVVVIAPITAGSRRSGRVNQQLAALGSPGEGPHSSVVAPDRGAKEAMGGNYLDPAFRAAAARAGRAQAARVRDEVAVAWGSPPA